MAGTSTITTIPPFLTARTLQYSAWQLRNFMDGDPPGPGVADYESFRVKQRGAGADRSVDVGNTSLMQAWIRGSSRGGLGLYRADNIDYTAPLADTYLAQINTGLIFSAGDPTNPRIDQVFLRILDQQHDGGGSNLLQAQVVDGVATGGATLDNRTGVGATPANSILLADVLMPAAATTVATANIRDRRQFPLAGAFPPVKTAVDMVALQPPPGMIIGATGMAPSVTNLQGAALMYVPRRIVGATRIRWEYIQGGTALTGNYNIGIADASGRLIVSTGSVAFVGATTTVQVRSEAIAATTFEPGYYYVVMGAAGLAGGGVNYNGVPLNVTPASFVIPAIGTPNALLGNGSGGITMPSTILGFVDFGALTSITVDPSVPFVALSVG